MNPTRHAHTGGSVSRGTIPMGAASSCAHALQKLRRRLLVHPGTSELAQVGCVRPAARRLRQNTVIVHAAAEACTIRLQRPATARGYCYWRGGKQRWRFEYNGVVYITVETCRHEITTWRVVDIVSGCLGARMTKASEVKASGAAVIIMVTGVIAALNRGRRHGRQRPSFFVDFLDAFGPPVPPKATADALVRQNNVGIPRSQGLGGRCRRLRCSVWSWASTAIDLVIIQQARKEDAVDIPLRIAVVRSVPREAARPAKAAPQVVESWILGPVPLPTTVRGRLCSCASRDRRLHLGRLWHRRRTVMYRVRFAGWALLLQRRHFDTASLSPEVSAFTTVVARVHSPEAHRAQIEIWRAQPLLAHPADVCARLAALC